MKKFQLKVDEDTFLKYPRTDYSETIFEIVEEQRSYLREWLPWVDTTQSVKDIRKFLKESILFNKGGQRLTTFIFFKETLAGSIGFVHIDKNNCKGEIGYWLRQDLQGYGIITKSCATLIQYAFEELNLNRIIIKVHKGNIKSSSIPLRLGFAHEATLREEVWTDEGFHDVELYSILKKEWILPVFESYRPDDQRFV